jgi:hypothetical protein
MEWKQVEGWWTQIEETERAVGGPLSQIRVEM